MFRKKCVFIALLIVRSRVAIVFEDLFTDQKETVTRKYDVQRQKLTQVLTYLVIAVKF